MDEKLPVIEMVDVSVVSPQRPETPQIENIQWRVLANEFWVIGGLHGAGKSNLLATAAGLQNPLRGKVHLFGRDTSALPEKDLADERQRIGLVFEEGGRTFNYLTVAENIALPLRYHRNGSEAEVEEEVRKVLEPTGLLEYAQKTPGTLSPSWRQRVALARALALRPKVLLLGKPLTAVELRHRRWWIEFLQKLLTGSVFLEKQPMTLIIATEDIQPWIEIGTHFAILKKKRWQFLGNRAELKNNQEQWQDLGSDEFIF